jgi:cytochrome c oxidase subunit II
MMGLTQFAGNLVPAAWAMIPLQPPAASSIAESVDHLYYFLTGITIFFSVLIFSIIFYFMIKYRRRPGEERAPETHTSMALELSWTIIPSLICVVIFVWSSALFVRNARPPAKSREIFVIGKQWMWQIQHPEGPREIDALHVPVGEPIKLTMTSQDVIHGFYIPAFRVKKDVLPGRYTSVWFKADQAGVYHLFCSQFCGTNHSEMIGWVYVMQPADYAAWLAAGEQSESMAQQGARLFVQLGCITCHTDQASSTGPSLAGIYGQPEKMQGGGTRVVDDSFVRDAILTPSTIHVAGYPQIMPTFTGQVNEEQVLQLIAYVKSLGTQERTNGK